MVFPETGVEFSPATEQPNRQLLFSESNLRGIEITDGSHGYAEGWYVSPKKQTFTWAGMAHVRVHGNPWRGDVTRYLSWAERFCALVAGQQAIIGVEGSIPDDVGPDDDPFDLLTTHIRGEKAALASIARRHGIPLAVADGTDYERALSLWQCGYGVEESILARLMRECMTYNPESGQTFPQHITTTLTRYSENLRGPGDGVFNVDAFDLSFKGLCDFYKEKTGQNAYNEREKEYCYNQIEAPIFSPTSLERLSRMQQLALVDTKSRHVHIQRFGRKVWRKGYHLLEGFGKPHFVNLTGLAVALRNYSEESRPSYGQCEILDPDGLMPTGYLQTRKRPEPPILPDRY